MTSAPAPVADPRTGSAIGDLPRGVLWWAAGVTAVLVLAGGRYGFHRDELYFVEAGHHPAWGYPDQPPLVPLLATAWYELVGGSLWAFRIVPAVLAGLIVVVTGLTSAALGGTRRDQVASAAVAAISVVVVAVGRLFSTTTFDLLLTATLILLLIVALDRDGGLGRWLVIGLLAGVALEVKTLPATVLACAGTALLIVGPRTPLRRPGPWLAAAVAFALAVPNLWWQDRHGWPQLELARAIAAGSSGTSTSRWLVIPLQLLLAGPVLTPVLVVGVVALLRRADQRPYRWVAVTFLLLVVLIVVTGGKAYYTAGLLPALLAAGMPATLRWIGAARWRGVLAAGLVTVHVLLSAPITLPLVPEGLLHNTSIVSTNYDVGETVGWPAFVAAAQRVVDSLPTGQREQAVILTSNYGEAGALDQARRAGADLPPVYSGHNAYGEWGPPPSSATTAVVIGWFDDDDLARWFTACRTAATVDNGVDLDNDEQGAPIRICSGPAAGWPAIWPQVRHLG
jgi:hypothetical protein